MSLSFWKYSEKTVPCHGPCGEFSIAESVDLSIGSLWDQFYVVHYKCEKRTKRGDCRESKRPCLLENIQDAILKRAYFPEVSTGFLLPASSREK